MKGITPEEIPVTQGHEPVAANALATGDYISLKNAHKVLVTMMHYSGGGDTDLVLSFKQAQDVAATGAKTLSATMPLWVNVDTSLTDTMAKQTDAAGYTIDTGDGKDQIVQFMLDASKLDMANGFDCIALHSTGGNASNIVSVLYQIVPRYAQATPPSRITD